MDRGDVYEVALDPAVGRETMGRRRVLVLTTKAINKIGVGVVVPIMTDGSYERERGFTVNLGGEGATTTGVAICNQPRALDVAVRGGKFIEKLSDAVVNEVIEKVLALFD